MEHNNAAEQVDGTVLNRPLSMQKDRLPRHFAGGSDLPNGWRITPAGKAIADIGDLVTNLTVSPDGRIVIGMNSGYLPHGITTFDTKTQKQIQHIGLPSAWLGMTWSPDGHKLFISGGNASGDANKAHPVAPIYEFAYTNGRLSEKPTEKFVETIDPKSVWWSGVAYLSGRHWLYAANRGTGPGPSDVVVFDTVTGQIVARIPVEVNPYQAVLTPDSRYLFVSNWSSESVSVIDTGTNRVVRTLHVGMNPNDMKLSSDGRLFVACSNDNTVYVFDTRTLRVIERLSTTLTPLAPEGSTPDALAIDNIRKLLYIANADNNSVAIVDIKNRIHSNIVGFIPTGWYPSALALADHDRLLYIGNAKGEEGHANGNWSGLLAVSKRGDDMTDDREGECMAGTAVRCFEYIGALQTSSLEAVSVAELRKMLPNWTKEVVDNTPYNDSLLSEALPPSEPSIIPQAVGVSTPIKHIIYIIKENKTYDEVLGDLPHANGDPRLAIFGEKVTPNQHELAKEYVTFDNLYCDGEVSVDGHSWSDAAYATDFAEKTWPAIYSAISSLSFSLQAFGLTNGGLTVNAMVPSGGYIWDLAQRKGLTYRSYGEFAARASTGTTLEGAAGAKGLVGHVATDYGSGLNVRDTNRVEVFLREFRKYEANYDSPDPNKRLPNFIVMSLPEDHTEGTTPGAYTPIAMVANNDYAVGQLVDAVSHSRYWPSTAIFIIEDDAQDGPDHVDARRTVGLVISPYVKRGIVDSTFYTTSSMLRTMELLLGLPPMSQYDAAAMPMYAAFGTTPIVTPFNVIRPLVDVNARNTKNSYGAAASSRMNFSEPDHAPMHALNEIIWKSVKGANSVMPPPVHRFRPLIDVSESDKGGDQD